MRTYLTFSFKKTADYRMVKERIKWYCSGRIMDLIKVLMFGADP